MSVSMMSPMITTLGLVSRLCVAAALSSRLAPRSTISVGDLTPACSASCARRAWPDLKMRLNHAVQKAPAPSPMPGDIPFLRALRSPSCGRSRAKPQRAARGQAAANALSDTEITVESANFVSFSPREGWFRAFHLC